MDSNSKMQHEKCRISGDALLGVLSPVMDWYQPDDQDPRNLLDILSDIVDDLQSDRAAALAGMIDKERLDFLDAHPCPSCPIEVSGRFEDGQQGKFWAIAFHGGTLREAIDAWRLSTGER